MAYEYSFMDNQVIGVDHLNKLTKRFVTSGVADPFTNGVPYNVSKFNDIVKANGTSGVVPSNISTLRVTKTSGNTVSVNTGTAFFANGSTIDVTSPESLNFTPGVKNYVYLKSDMAQNKNYPACTTAQPTGDYVILAEIDHAGTVTDKRAYAKGKLPGYCSNANVMLQAELVYTANGHTTNDSKFTNVSKTLYLGENNYTMMFLSMPQRSNMGASSIFCQLTTGESYVLQVSGGGGYNVESTNISSSIKIYSGYGNIYLTGAIANNTVTLTANGNSSAIGTFTIHTYIA